MSYHQRMMNIPCPTGRDTAFDYVYGHRDARHAAAEIANEADAEVERLREINQLWYDTGTAIMQIAMGCEGPLSDSDVISVIEVLRRELDEARSAAARTLAVSEQQRAERERVFATEVQRLRRRVPNPDDLRLLAASTMDYVQGRLPPTFVNLGTVRDAVARVRATLEEA